MPTYQYACTECAHSFERVQSFSDDALTECPQCQGRLRKLFNAVGVVFKGSGFYRNDSRGAQPSESGSSTGESSSSTSDSSTTKSTESSGKPSDTSTPKPETSSTKKSDSAGSGPSTKSAQKTPG